MDRLMTPVAHLALAQARRLALRSLAPEFPPQSVGEAVRGLGYVQIDTIAVIERAHHHVLWTRLPTYDTTQLSRAQREDRQIVEYWWHAAAYLPMEDYRYCRPRMLAYRQRHAAWFGANKRLIQHVLQRIQAEGPLRSADFEAGPEHRPGPWWDWKPAKLALEHLFHAGRLLVTYRRGFHKYFDLPERVLPAQVPTRMPMPQDYGAYVILKTLECHGLATEQEFAYLKAHARLAIRQALQAMLRKKTLLPVTVEGISGMYFVRPAHLESILSAAALGDQQPPPVWLLSPFDNLVIQRRRLQQFFGFDYQIECYVPAPKRRYGYFCLPILWGDCFVGRLDPKAHRASGRLQVLALHLEPGLRQHPEFMAALSRTLQHFARFNGCTSVELPG